MGAGPSKCVGVGGGGIGGAELMLGEALVSTLLREANRHNPERAIHQQLMFGRSPIERVFTLAQRAIYSSSTSSEQSTTDSFTESSTESSTEISTDSSTNSSTESSNQNATKSQNRSRQQGNHEPDPSSETNEDLNDIRDVAYHFERRLTRFVRLGGMSQFVTEYTGIERNDVLYEGCSEYQDRSTSISGHQAAHVVRVRINTNIEINFPQTFEHLRKFVEHTHIVPFYANAWRRIGGDIDRIQERFLQEIISIDFRGDLTAQVEDILGRLKQAFLDAFQSAIGSGRYNAQQVKKLEAVVAAFRGITIPELFEKGRYGLGYLPAKIIIQNLLNKKVHEQYKDA